jgi:pimeloyl-ACP methyl ester carboxylesterase
VLSIRRVGVRRSGMKAINTLFVATLAVACHQAEGTPMTKQTGYAPVNGLSYYYEVRGEGEPLLLLHGGLGSIDMFSPASIDGLTAGRKVIAVDLHGHGRTALGTRDIDLVAIGDDLAGVLAHLKIDRADVLGYSFGGGAAIRLAVQHPKLVRRLVVVSAPFSDEGWHAEMKPQQAAVGAGMFEMMKETPLYKSYAAVAPKPEFPRLLDQMGALMRRQYNWADDVRKIEAQTLLVYGDSDMVTPQHIVEFYKLLGGGLRDAGWQREHMGKNRLAIVPDLTHYEMFNSPVLVSTVRPFLDGKTHK